MSDLTELLKEYDDWKTRKSFAQPASAPEDFIREKRIKRILNALREIFDVDAGLINHYFEDEDVEWVNSQGTTEVTVDGEV